MIKTNAASVAERSHRALSAALHDDITLAESSECGPAWDIRDALSVLDLAPVFVTDFHGMIRFWSAGCTRLYGWSADEAVGQSAHKLLKTIFPVPLQEIEAILLSHNEWSGDLIHHRRDGVVITVAARKVLRAGAPLPQGSVMESVTDVTDLRRVEAGLRELNTNLEDKISEEIAKRESAQHRLFQNGKMVALNELAGGMAHDFNNVLQAISGLGALIARRAGDIETVERLSGFVEEAVLRGSVVTRRLLSFTSRGDLKPEALSVTGTLSRVCERLEQMVGSGITVQVEIESDLPFAFADEGQFEIALMNLASNAFEAMAGGGVLTIGSRVEQVSTSEVYETLKPGDYISVSVSDTGKGMDKPTLDRAFEPFFTTKPRKEGTGLGLTMAKSFAEKSGGYILVSSQAGQGTIVKLLLPVATAQIARTPNRDRLIDAGPNAPWVLVVEDEDMIRHVVAADLRDRGFQVLEADGGDEALDILERDDRVSVLISDLAMPGMTGRVLIREAHRRKPGLPAILLTGYAGADFVSVDGDNVGAYTLLHKPISGAILANRIVSLLN